MRTHCFSIRRLALPALLVGASALMLSGCATTRDVRAANKNAETITYHYQKAAKHTRTPSSDFVVSNSFYAAKTPIATPLPNRRATLPSAFFKPATLPLTPSISLANLSHMLSKVSGYRVDFAPEITQSSSQGAKAPTAAAISLDDDALAAVRLSNVAYKGDLAGLLDYIANTLGVSWKWTGNSIRFFRTETKMFRLAALVGAYSSSTSLNSTSNSGTSQGGQAQTNSGLAGGSGQQTKVQSDFNLWKDVSETLKDSLSNYGSMTVAQSAGIITVRDTPDALARIGKEVAQFNRIYGKQVLLDVEVYSIQRSASDANALNWSAVWKSAAKRYGFSYSSLLGSGSSSGQSGVQAVSIGGNLDDGPFKGSSAVFKALSTLGHTTLLTSGTVSTLSGQSVPMKISREQAYLASYSTTLSSGLDAGTAQTTLTPGVVVDGFFMHFTPKILANNNILMRFSVNLSNTDSIKTFTAPDGTSAIQLPTRSVRDFMQTVSVHNNQTVVLTGFQQTSTDNQNQGPFSPNNILMGGSRNSSAKTNTIVIVVTPHIIAPAQ